MPLLLKLDLPYQTRIAVWKIDESNQWLESSIALSSNDKTRFEKFISPTRKAEFLAIRGLLAVLNIKDEIEYDEYGKPHLKKSGEHISISHTRGYAAVLVSLEKNTGLDLEILHPRIEKLSNRFASDQELLWCTGPDRLKFLYVIWGAKEAIYKAYSKCEILFKEQMEIKQFRMDDAGTTTGIISINGEKKIYIIEYRILNDLVITWASEAT